MERENSDKYWNKYPKKEGTSSEKMEQKGKESLDNQTNRERKSDMLTSRTGGAYIPPAKLRLMQQNISDKSSAAYQRIAWEALKKSIHGCINKVNTANIDVITSEILRENIVRGRGLLCKSIIQAQAASPTFTNVYAALVAVINSKFPNIGELLLKRLVLQFKRGYKQNNKTICMSACTFIAHLINQRVAHEILALEILTLLTETPTDDSVEIAISFLKECGQRLTEVSSRGINAIFEMLRNILHEGKLEKRIQYMIEVIYQIRKDGFKDHAAVIQELDLVNEEDQLTHLITLDSVKQAEAQDILNVFKFDENYEENEGKYKLISNNILGSDDSDSEGSDGDEEDEDDEEEKEEKNEQSIIDNTETNLTILRRTIYLTIQSSLDFEECAHKLLKMNLKPGQEVELCHMFLDCCAEQRTYEKFYGLLAERFCKINKIYVEPFQEIFKNTFLTTHRLDTNRIRNVSKFCAHLLFTDSISWEVLEVIKLNEEDSNSSNRVFVKILFQELSEYMGLKKLNERLKDPTMQPYFEGIFPRNDPKNTRFAINFFTLIGLGGLTDDLREHLKSFKPAQVTLLANSSSSDSDSSSSDSSSSSSSDSDSSSETENEKKKTRKKKKTEKVSKEESQHKNVKQDKKHWKESEGKLKNNKENREKLDKSKEEKDYKERKTSKHESKKSDNNDDYQRYKEKYNTHKDKYSKKHYEEDRDRRYKDSFSKVYYEKYDRKDKRRHNEDSERYERSHKKYRRDRS